jgi:hypothetical protein
MHRFNGLRVCAGFSLGLSLASAVTSGCGGEDAARTEPHRTSEAGQGGLDGAAAGQPATPRGGSVTQTEAGSPARGDGGSSDGGVGGESGQGGTPTEAGATNEAGASGAAGESGCDLETPIALAGLWSSSCGNYTCTVNIAASGAVSSGCTNGQYSSGTVGETGAIETEGEGGAFDPYSTSGQFTRTGCDSLRIDYTFQMPPHTGTPQANTCTWERRAACDDTLLATLTGTWKTTCGSSTCTTTFTAEGAMSSTCSNGQHSTGSVDETGAFSDTGEGGNFPAYSTKGVIALGDCDTFLMPYTYQSPPNQGTKHSQQCSYTRQQDE